MGTTSVPGSYPAHPSFPSQHHAWFPFNQEMCFDFALIFQVSPTFMPAWSHAPGPGDWLGAHVLTMCLRVTFQALRGGLCPWQQHLLLIFPPSGKDTWSWNLIWFFFSYLEMCEFLHLLPSTVLLNGWTQWFQISFLFLDIVSAFLKKTLHWTHMVAFYMCMCMYELHFIS